MRTHQGFILFISLIVLLMMSLAGIALARSVNTANLIAGNIAFKQGSIAATDLGIQTAMTLFDASSGYLGTESNTYSDSTAHCYSATAFNKDGGSALKMVDPRGVPNVLLNKSSFDSSYAACSSTSSSTGETIRYVIDRQCDSTVSGAAASEANCNVFSISSTSGSVSTSTTATGSETVPLYRISVRVDGPRQTTSYAQVIIHP